MPFDPPLGTLPPARRPPRRECQIRPVRAVPTLPLPPAGLYGVDMRTQVDRGTRVVVLVLPDVNLLDLGGPVQVFDAASYRGGRYRLEFVAETPAIASVQGLRLAELGPLGPVGPGDLVLIPGPRLHPPGAGRGAGQPGGAALAARRGPGRRPDRVGLHRGRRPRRGRAARRPPVHHPLVAHRGDAPALPRRPGAGLGALRPRRTDQHQRRLLDRHRPGPVHRGTGLGPTADRRGGPRTRALPAADRVGRPGQPVPAAPGPPQRGRAPGPGAPRPARRRAAHAGRTGGGGAPVPARADPCLRHHHRHDAAGVPAGAAPRTGRDPARRDRPDRGGRGRPVRLPRPSPLPPAVRGPPRRAAVGRRAAARPTSQPPCHQLCHSESPHAPRSAPACPDRAARGAHAPCSPSPPSPPSPSPGSRRPPPTCTATPRPGGRRTGAAAEAGPGRADRRRRRRRRDRLGRHRCARPVRGLRPLAPRSPCTRWRPAGRRSA